MDVKSSSKPHDIGREALLTARDVAKRFGATQALRGASFELRAGEVHVLVGENGSGKSTLVKILSGVHVADAGELALGDRGAPPRSPAAAQKLSIATVFQEVLVAGARSVLDNVWLGADTLLKQHLPPKRKRSLAIAQFKQLLDAVPDLDQPVEELSLSTRQACCIVRGLLRNPRIFILDEATSSLDIATRDRLFAVIRRLRDEGIGVLFITHRMDEITELGDRITVMRSGETVATLERGTWTPRQLVELMTGSDRLVTQTRTCRDSATGNEVLLKVERLQLRPSARAFDLTLRRGELVGVAGLEGHGQDLFLDALRGIRPYNGAVAIRTPESFTPIRSTKSAAASGIAYVPRDRRQAIFSWMAISENFGLPTLSQDRRLGLLSPRATRERFSSYVKDLGIVLRNPRDSISTLSGGNQQKIVISRWLAAHPRLLILNDPTRGIDIGAKHDLYALIGHLIESGVTVVMLSSELDEHIDLMDRVLVFREHELFDEIPHTLLTRQALVASFFGQRQGAVSG